MLNRKVVAPAIVVYKNVYPESYKIIDYVNSIDSWHEGEIAGTRIGSEEKALVYKEIRDVSVFSSEYNNPFTLDIQNSISECETDYIKYFGIEREYKHEHFQIAKYETGQLFNNHMDSQPEFPRTISSVYYFNDNYEGGELYFDKFDLTIKPEAKDLILFPSMWAYSHTANAVKSGTKYAMISFLV